AVRGAVGALEHVLGERVFLDERQRRVLRESLVVDGEGVQHEWPGEVLERGAQWDIGRGEQCRVGDLASAVILSRTGRQRASHEVRIPQVNTRPPGYPLQEIGGKSREAQQEQYDELTVVCALAWPRRPSASTDRLRASHSGDTWDRLATGDARETTSRHLLRETPASKQQDLE